eukprot:g82180.t1
MHRGYEDALGRGHDYGMYPPYKKQRPDYSERYYTQQMQQQWPVDYGWQQAAAAPAQPPVQSHIQAGPNQLTLRLLVDARAVGGLIGKKGLVINQLRDDTGCKMDIPKVAQGATKRIVTVAGEMENLAVLLSMITTRLHDQRLQTSSTSSDDAETSSSSSSSSSDSSSSSPSSSSPSGSKSSPPADPSSSSPTATTAGPARSPDYTVTFLVDNSLVGGLIGKGGSKIANLRATSGATIQVSEKPLDNSTEKSVRISAATSEVVDSVVSKVLKLLVENGALEKAVSIPYSPPGTTPYGQGAYGQAGYGYAYGQQPAANAPQTSVVIALPSSCVGAVIGKGGRNVSDVRARSGATIKISEQDPSAEGRTITITGSHFQTELASALLNQKITETLSGGTVATSTASDYT